MSGQGEAQLPAERQSITHRFCIGGQTGYVTASFFPDGRVQAGTLADDAVNANINPLFKFKPGTWIVFHSNGQVLQGTLAESRSISELFMDFAAGQQVTFKENGMPLDEYSKPLKANTVYVRSEASSGCAFGNRMCIN